MSAQYFPACLILTLEAKENVKQAAHCRNAGGEGGGNSTCQWKKMIRLNSRGEACEVEEHQDIVFSPPLFSFVLGVLMTFHQHETLGQSCHSCCQISQNNSDIPAAARAQSLWWESALSLQTHISNLDTCARCLIFPLTVEWKKVLSVCGGKPRCTRSLISHGGALTDAPELKRLDKCHVAYWLNGGSHSGLSAPIKAERTLKIFPFAVVGRRLFSFTYSWQGMVFAGCGEPRWDCEVKCTVCFEAANSFLLCFFRCEIVMLQ